MDKSKEKKSRKLSEKEKHTFNFDSSKKSILQRRLLPKDEFENPSFKKYLSIYFMLVFISWIIPLLYTLLTQPSIVEPSEKLILPFLLDVNVTMICLISTPFLLILYLRERKQISDTLQNVYALTDNKYPREKFKEFVDSWEKEFGKVNKRAQYIGFIIFCFIIFLNIWGHDSSNYAGKLWQTYNTHNFFNAAGIFYLVFQVGLFFFIAAQIVIREIYIVRLFFDFTKKFEIDIKPLHPDKVGGLKSVANLGLSYQVAVALMGVNLGTMVITSGFIGRGEQTEFIIIAIIFYALVAPVVFIGPLIPFRLDMVNSKEATMARISDRFEKQMKSTFDKVERDKLTKTEIEKIVQLNELYSIVSKFPEWPFDISTIRKFSSVFISPLIPIFLSWGFTKLMEDIF
jgi:hypothetical protein